MKITKLERLLTNYWVFIGFILLTIALRFISAFQVGLEVDEPINYAVARFVFREGYPATRGQLLEPRALYFYHPPIAFHILAIWFWLTEVSIDAMRIFSVFCSTLAIVTLSSFIRNRVNKIAGTIAIFLLGTDGWLIVTNSMGYLENIQLILLAFGIRVYWLAVQDKKENLKQYLLAGLLAGSVFLFKHIGVYFLIGLGFYWLASRRHFKGHLVLLAVVSIMTIIYGVWMYWFYSPWGSVWWEQTTVQFMRTIGLRSSRGLNYDLGTAIEVILNRYWIFGATIIGLASGAIASLIVYFGLNEFLRQLRLRPSVLTIAAWGIGAILFGLGAALKSPHYLMLWLLPFWTLVSVLTQRLLARDFTLGVLVLYTIFLFNLGTFGWRIGVNHGDVVEDSAFYMRTNLPASSIVATEPYIGVLIEPLQYVRSDLATLVSLRRSNVTHVAAYWSTTAGIPNNIGGDVDLWKYCSPIREEFTGFKDHVIICRVDPEKLDQVIRQRGQ